MVELVIFNENYKGNCRLDINKSIDYYVYCP